jgi:hypothetical protein
VKYQRVETFQVLLIFIPCAFPGIVTPSRGLQFLQQDFFELFAPNESWHCGPSLEHEQEPHGRVPDVEVI